MLNFVVLLVLYLDGKRTFGKGSIYLILNGKHWEYAWWVPYCCQGWVAPTHHTFCGCFCKDDRVLRLKLVSAKHLSASLFPLQRKWVVRWYRLSIWMGISFPVTHYIISAGRWYRSSSYYRCLVYHSCHSVRCPHCYRWPSHSLRGMAQVLAVLRKHQRLLPLNKYTWLF